MYKHNGPSKQADLDDDNGEPMDIILAVFKKVDLVPLVTSTTNLFFQRPEMGALSDKNEQEEGDEIQVEGHNIE